MGRHRQPIEIARLRGADRKNPQRYRGEVPKSPNPLGDPPDYMGEAETAAWHEIASLTVPGVLTSADSFILELAANLLAEFRKDPPAFPSGRLTHLIGCLARMGLTPSDRRGLAFEKPSNPYSKFPGSRSYRPPQEKQENEQ